MRTLSTLKGLPVRRKNGQLLGTITDLVISSEGLVEGLLLDRKNLLRKKSMIPLPDVLSFDNGSITVRQNTNVLPIKGKRIFTLTHQHAIFRKLMTTSHGEVIGLLDDVYFSEQKGKIVAYEISNGFFSDITEGKKMVHTAESPSLEEDAIVIST